MIFSLNPLSYTQEKIPEGCWSITAHEIYIRQVEGHYNHILMHDKQVTICIVYSAGKEGKGDVKHDKYKNTSFSNRNK